jgi:hypothetical protein
MPPSAPHVGLLQPVTQSQKKLASGCTQKNLPDRPLAVQRTDNNNRCLAAEGTQSPAAFEGQSNKLCCLSEASCSRSAQAQLYTALMARRRAAWHANNSPRRRGAQLVQERRKTPGDTLTLARCNGCQQQLLSSRQHGASLSGLEICAHGCDIP